MDMYKSYYSYVRRLGQWHLMGNSGYTLCNKPMLSTNRSEFIPIEERSKCKECFVIADKEMKGEDIHES
jgi:hypothetical protein